MPSKSPLHCCVLGMLGYVFQCGLHYNVDVASQKSMSGIAVSEDAVNMYYYLKAKSTVGPMLCEQSHTTGVLLHCLI